MRVDFVKGLLLLSTCVLAISIFFSYNHIPPEQVEEDSTRAPVPLALLRAAQKNTSDTTKQSTWGADSQNGGARVRSQNDKPRQNRTAARSSKSKLDRAAGERIAPSLATNRVGSHLNEVASHVSQPPQASAPSKTVNSSSGPASLQSSASKTVQTQRICVEPAFAASSGKKRTRTALVRYSQPKVKSYAIAIAQKVPRPFKIAVFPPQQDRFISAAISRGGLWDPPIASMIINALRSRPGNMIDCGGNIGYYSLIAASLGSKVIAFEPGRENVDRFALSVEVNQFQDRVTLFKNGLSNTVNTFVLSAMKDNQGGRSLKPTQSSRNVVDSSVEEITTVVLQDVDEVKRLDNVTLMKIDVEGFEAAVVDGAISVLRDKNIPYVAMEIGPETKASKRCPFARMVKAMELLGYRAFNIVHFPPSPNKALPLGLKHPPDNIYWAKLPAAQQKR